MAHASDADLDALEPLLVAIRALGGATERKRGIFYRGRTAFLHFHAFPAPLGLVADLKEGAEFVRYPVGTKAGQRKLLAAIRRNIRG